MAIIEKTGITDEEMIKRFQQGEVPLKGTSNNYFFQAAMQCNTNGLTKEKAIDQIKIIYDKWFLSESFSKRPWSNILFKINNVYKQNLKLVNLIGGDRKEWL